MRRHCAFVLGLLALVVLPLGDGFAEDARAPAEAARGSKALRRCGNAWNLALDEYEKVNKVNKCTRLDYRCYMYRCLVPLMVDQLGVCNEKPGGSRGECRLGSAAEPAR